MFAGCGQTVHTPVDLQLDVDAELPEEAETVTLCVTDGVSEGFGAADGSWVLVGLPEMSPVGFTLDVEDESGAVIGRVGPMEINQPWTAGAYDARPCGGVCQGCTGGGARPPREQSRTLAVRFVWP